MPGNVVVVRSVNLHLVDQVDRHPRPGETVCGPDLRRNPGGKGANQAVRAQAGGRDRRSSRRWVRTTRRRSCSDHSVQTGVDTSAVQLTGSPTGVTLISVSTVGDNSIMVAPGANSHVRIDDAARFELQNAEVVLAQV